MTGNTHFIWSGQPSFDAVIRDSHSSSDQAGDMVAVMAGELGICQPGSGRGRGGLRPVAGERGNPAG
ncbi:hypothetical protein MARHY1290 [Marinobacter nauticus ATCC 49840]|nr:hypothetical protein MARHY1290 [Marinobacter nauticus ATCC 49840]